MKFLATVFFALGSFSAFADEIRLGMPAYGGNGCPQGTASAVLSPDFKTLSVLFDSYSAEAGNTTGRAVDRKTCNLAVPIHVPNGMSVSLVQVDYRGYNNLPRNASSKLTVDYFFAGQRGPSFSKQFFGEMNQDYLFSNELQGTAVTWSPCGEGTNLRINTSMVAMANARGDQTMASVDSADIKSGLLYHLQFRPCTK